MCRLFGGWDGTDTLNDVWVLERKRSWLWHSQRILPVGFEPNAFSDGVERARALAIACRQHVPCARRGHSAVRVSEQLLLVFGGLHGNSRFLNDVFLLDVSARTWRRLDVSGEAPSPRAWHSAWCALATL